MIIEYLTPDPSLLDGLTVVARGLLYAVTIGGAGLVFFLALFGERLEIPEIDALSRLAAVLVISGLVVSLGTLVLRVGVLSAGASLTDPAIWTAVMRSRIGDAFLVRCAGLVLMLAVLMRTQAGCVIAAIGGIAVIASYAAMGHSMLFRPRQELAALVVLHLALVGFWIGSLPALARIASRADHETAAKLIEYWSRWALAAVVLIVISGALLAWYLVGRVDLMIAAWYGWGLMAKVALVAVVIALAARHKLSLTPLLAKGEAGAGARLARSIRVEFVIAVIVFYAAAEMVSVHPIDYGHRVPT